MLDSITIYRNHLKRAKSNLDLAVGTEMHKKLINSPNGNFMRKIFEAMIGHLEAQVDLIDKITKERQTWPQKKLL